MLIECTSTTTKTETICFTNNPTASDFITPSTTPSRRQAQTKRRPHLEARATTAIPTHGIIPYYATSACNDEHYSSACSCIGVETATITQANYVCRSEGVTLEQLAKLVTDCNSYCHCSHNRPNKWLQIRTSNEHYKD